MFFINKMSGNIAKIDSLKAYGINIINDFSSGGTLNICDGYMFLGESFQNNIKEKKQILPDNSYMGTSESRGNVSRNMYNTNSMVLYHSMKHLMIKNKSLKNLQILQQLIQFLQDIHGYTQLQMIGLQTQKLQLECQINSQFINA